MILLFDLDLETDLGLSLGLELVELFLDGPAVLRVCLAEVLDHSLL